MKKIIKTLVVLLITFSFVGMVDAATKEVLVEGTNIIGTDGKNGATWNDTTSTLTLNNYSGKNIEFGGFDSADVNIIFKGTNTIDGSGDAFYKAAIYVYDSSGDANVTVTGETGSVLNMKNYSSGIEIDGGKLTVKNATIVADNLSDVFYADDELIVDNIKLTATDSLCSLYSDSKITIKNSTITMTGGNDDIYTGSSGEILIQNSVIVSTENSDAFTYTENLTIKDSTLKYDAPYGLYNYGDIVINNSEITSEDSSEYAVDCDGDFTMTDSTFTIKDAYYALPINGELKVTNSSISVINANTAISVDYNIDAVNTDFYIKNSYTGLKGRGNTEINGGSITIISDDKDLDDAIGIEVRDIVLNTNVLIDLKNSEMIGINSDTIVINGGTIKVNNPNGYGVATTGLEMNGGEMRINSKFLGLQLFPGFLYMNAGALYVEVTEMAAIFAASLSDVPYENIIKFAHHTVLESNLKKVKTKGVVNVDDETITGWGYSFAETELGDFYDDINDVLPLIAKKVSIVGNKRVVFDANGGTGTMDNLYQEGKVTLPTNGFTAPNGKKFKGWSLTPNGEIITEVDIDKEIIVYAIWEDEEVPNTIDSIEYYIVGTFTLLSILCVSLSLKKKYN